MIVHCVMRIGNNGMKNEKVILYVTDHWVMGIGHSGMKNEKVNVICDIEKL